MRPLYQHEKNKMWLKYHVSAWKKYNVADFWYAEEATMDSATRLEQGHFWAQDGRINKHGFERQMKSVRTIEDLIGDVK